MVNAPTRKLSAVEFADGTMSERSPSQGGSHQEQRVGEIARYNSRKRNGTSLRAAGGNASRAVPQAREGGTRRGGTTRAKKRHNDPHTQELAQRLPGDASQAPRPLLLACVTLARAQEVRRLSRLQSPV